MNTLSLFNFNGREIHTIIIDGDPWFVAADVCRALGLRGYASKHLFQLAPDEKRVVKRSEVSQFDWQTSLFKQNTPAISIISESGLYRLVNRSDKPEARVFQDWVNREVLPAIRKDGSYVLGEEKVRTGEMSEDELIIAAMGALQRKVERVPSPAPASAPPPPSSPRSAPATPASRSPCPRGRSPSFSGLAMTT